MNIVDSNLLDLTGVFLGFILTLFVFSYAWGDNPLYKVAMNIFVGAAAGYALVITIYNIIFPQLIFPLFSGNRSEMILAVLFLIPCALVLTKVSSRLSKIGNPAMAILVGIGAAAAVGGAVSGTIYPQVGKSINIFENQNIINAGIILIGTLATLIFFHFGSVKDSSGRLPTGRIINGIRQVGQVFIAITFSAIFAGVYFATLTALIERLSFIWVFLKDYLGPTITGL